MKFFIFFLFLAERKKYRQSCRSAVYDFVVFRNEEMEDGEKEEGYGGGGGHGR